MPIYYKTIQSGNVIEKEIYGALKTRRCKDGVKTEATLRDINKNKTTEKQAEYNMRLARRHFQRIINTNFSWRNSLYVTLTYEGSEPQVDDAKKSLNNYIRRLRRSSPHLKYVVVTGRKSSERIHHHLIIANASPKDITSKWMHGKIKKIEALYKRNFDINGNDCGEDYSKLANYLFKHCKNVTHGKKWKQSRNIVQPLIKIRERKYDKHQIPHVQAGYDLIEKYENDCDYIGVYRYYKYVKIID